MNGMERDRLVSVIIPVYNGERYLAEAIESVLGQSYLSIEVIVVDDGSTDGSAHVAKAFGEAVRYSRQPHSGTGAALNHGIVLARGGFLAFLDADDVWVKQKLEWQMAAFQANPDVALVFGHVQQFISPELAPEIARRFRCPPEALPGYVTGTMLARREAFAQVGTFGSKWRAGEFLDWYLRATELGVRTVMLPNLVLRRRLHQANHGLVKREAKSDLTRILKAALDRRRAAVGHNG